MSTTETIVVDTENRFDWAQITSTFNELGVLTGKLTEYDNGNIKQESFDGVSGEISAVNERDIADVAGWFRIYTTYNSSGTATRTTRYDNGMLREEIIQPALSEDAPSYVSSRTDFDDGNAYSWDFRNYSYDLLGNLESSTMRYDDGRMDLRFYQNGLLTSRRQTDVNDAVSWTEIQTTYDQLGLMVERLTVYDDQSIMHETFEFGQRSNTYRSDEADAYSWSQIVTDYDWAGQISKRVTDYDDGSHTYEEFLDGQRTMMHQTDVTDAKNWETISTDYDLDGRLINRMINYDDGTYTYESFIDGQRSSMSKADALNVKNWETIGIQYDEAGKISHRLTDYDDGTFKFEQFENGLRTSTYQSDNLVDHVDPPEDGGAKNWETIETQYDEAGNVSSRLTDYDDGIVKFEQFENGVRSRTHLADNLVDPENPPEDGGVKNWETIDTRYDEAGKISSRLTEYDDGTVTYELFEDGVRTSTYQSDNFVDHVDPPVNGGAKNWETIETFYDESGNVAQKVVTYDNGSEAFTAYENGVRHLTLFEDTEDAFDWDFKFTNYDENGKVSARSTVQDNGDEMALFYEEQALMARVDIDGDGSHSWGAKLIEYQSGEAIVTTYDSVTELPDPYAAL